MVNPQFIEEKALSLLEVQSILQQVQQRDTELNFQSNKTKEYTDAFVQLTEAQKSQLEKKLQDLALTRLKHEHIQKILDFLPATANDLRAVLQAYPLTLPKKDQESIVAAVQEILKGPAP